jgi:hypothetical protein
MTFETLLPIVLLLTAGLFASRRGGPPEKLGALIIAALLFTDIAYHWRFGPSGFIEVDPFHLVLDGAELVAIWAIALHANRIWPLWAAAAQLICVAGHVAALIEPGGMSRAYWTMTQIPFFIQIAALLLGTAFHARRTQRIGCYRNWRFS